MGSARAISAIVLMLAGVGCGGASDEAENRATAPATSATDVPFDQAFIDAMVPHHREAIAMATSAKAAGLTEADLQKIADDIIASQQDEIDQMLAWREQWFGSRDVGPVLPEVLGVEQQHLGMEHGSADRVAAADDVDVAFSKMMIRHHEGAIEMAQVARGRGQHVEIQRLAEAVIEAQAREVGVMREYAAGDHH